MWDKNLEGSQMHKEISHPVSSQLDGKQHLRPGQANSVDFLHTEEESQHPVSYIPVLVLSGSNKLPTQYFFPDSF